MTLLREAVKQGAFQDLKILLVENPWLQEDLDDALIQACGQGDLQATKILLTFGADPFYKLYLPYRVADALGHENVVLWLRNIYEEAGVKFPRLVESWELEGGKK